MRMLRAITMHRFRSAAGRSLKKGRRRFSGVRWGPFVMLGAHIRVQAQAGHRAAVVELRPGLYLVADVPSKNLKPEFGVLPLLVPLIMSAAKSAMKGKKKKRRPPQLPGPVAEWADDDDLQQALDPKEAYDE